MTRKLRTWAKNHGFVWTARAGWVRDDGCALRLLSVGWRVMTPGGGFHPSLQPPKGAQ